MPARWPWNRVPACIWEGVGAVLLWPRGLRGGGGAGTVIGEQGRPGRAPVGVPSGRRNLSPSEPGPGRDERRGRSRGRWETDFLALPPVGSTGAVKGRRAGGLLRPGRAGLSCPCPVPEVGPWRPGRPWGFREKGPQPPAPEPGSHVELRPEGEPAPNKHWTAQLPPPCPDPQQALAGPHPSHTLGGPRDCSQPDPVICIARVRAARGPGPLPWAGRPDTQQVTGHSDLLPPWAAAPGAEWTGPAAARLGDSGRSW